MHFDPVPSRESSSAVRASRRQQEDLLDPEPDVDDLDDVDSEADAPRAARRRAGLPAPPPGAREGLPPSFRMRHQRHYVEQLMGDGPIRTVREIALADIEAPPESDANIRGLEESIRRVGVLEPLLVVGRNGQYHVITGVNRLRAARNVGLRSVPCLVHEVDEAMVKTMREAVTERAAEARGRPAAEMPAREVPAQETPGGLPPAFADVTAGLQFVSALMPAIAAAEGHRFRQSVLTDLAGLELLRARTVAAAAEALAGSPLVSREEADCGELVGRVLDSLAAEARLRGVALDVRRPEGFRMPLDPALTATALTGLIQSLLALPGPGAVLRVHAEGTAVRPALVVRVEQESAALEPEALRRFFDGEWREHPAGGAGALLLAGAAHIARLHGGRADVQPIGHEHGSGYRVTFVIPKPIGG